MKLPKEILDKILELSYELNKKEIAKNFRIISDRYINEKNGKSLLNQNDEAIAYAIARMPATYAATSTVCSQVFEIIERKNSKAKENFKTLIDVGAGTGSATLSISEQLNLEKITCLEREAAMIDLGKTLLSESLNMIVKNASWKNIDISDYIHSDRSTTKKDDKENNETLLKADIVISSYMLNEFAEENILKIVNVLWRMTNDVLIIVEPGTPNDYKRLMKVKDYLIENGGNVIAPCICEKKCNLPLNDWCNFTCRVERTKLQKEVKCGNVPFEDEKFMYLAVSKNDYNSEKDKIARIIRHPIIKSGMVEVKLCLNEQIINKTYTKKDKEIYKKIRKVKVGDIIEINKF